jgi:hypothetical protein
MLTYTNEEMPEKELENITFLLRLVSAMLPIKHRTLTRLNS